MTIVIKRDGTKQPFSETSLKQAIFAAAESAKRDIPNPKKIIEKILEKVEGRKTISVPELQHIVEHVLMGSAHKDVATAYIEYRHDRDKARESNSKLLGDIKGFLSRDKEEFTKENANKDSKAVSTHRDLLAGILSKHFATTQLLPKDVAANHKAGFIHVHDLDYLLSPLTNCCLVNYRDMLAHGFKVGDAQISTPNSIGVASTILTQIIQAVASAQYGGQTLAHIDSGLAPYVEKSYNKLLADAKQYNLPQAYVDAKIEKEVYDAMQAFLYQVNTLTTSNGQTPFISISLGLDTSRFGKMVTEQYLKVHNKGLGKESTTPVFPKVIFFLQDGVNLKQGDENYNLKQAAIDCSVNRIYPDYVSVPLNRKVTGSTKEPVSPMGCRSFLSKYNPSESSDDEKYDGRFNLGVVTLNLPMIAKERAGDFFVALDEYMELAYKAHMYRVSRLKGTQARQNPVLFMEGAIARLGPDQTVDSLFYNGYASISIGFIGLHECSELLGDVSKESAMKILEAMKAKIGEFKERSNIGFSLYGTPSEGYALRAARCYKERFGEESLSRDYFTNSFHQPVWAETTPFAKWEYEEGFAYLSSGGNIGYIEQPSLKNNKQAYETFLDYAYEHIPYFGINMPVDHCHKCDYHGEFKASAEGYECPNCGNSEEGTISVIRRISGYLTAPNSRPVNKGKQQEIMERVKHANK